MGSCDRVFLTRHFGNQSSAKRKGERALYSASSRKHYFLALAFLLDFRGCTDWGLEK